MQLQDAPPQPPVSETPAIGGTSAQRLARALGTEVGVDAEGNATVEFPAPGAPPFVPFSTAPRTVSRAEVTDTPAPAAASSQNGASPAGAQPGAPEVNVDELAETVIERLRRELLIEREQAGGSMDLI
jgi:hypothetical protein